MTRVAELVAQLEDVLAPSVVATVVALIEEQVSAATSASAAAPPSPWLALDEAAMYLRVSERTLERAISRGRLRSTTLGRRRLLHRDDLDDFARAATREETAPTAPPRRR